MRTRNRDLAGENRNRQIAKEINTRIPKIPLYSHIRYPKVRNELFQADLMVFKGLKRDLVKGYTYILTVIDLYSRFAWAVGLKDAKAATVLEAWKRLRIPTPKMLHIDRGSEFKAAFSKHMKEKGVKVYATYNYDIKAAVVERFNRTLRGRLAQRNVEWKLNNKEKWEKDRRYPWSTYLQEEIDKYNSKRHGGTLSVPKKVYRGDVEPVRSVRPHSKKSIAKSRAIEPFAEGDLVRIAAYKEAFDKRAQDNFSEEVFVVKRVVSWETPYYYYLMDQEGEDIEGRFYHQELLPTKFG